jgi:hypothetical protein
MEKNTLTPENNNRADEAKALNRDDARRESWGPAVALIIMAGVIAAIVFAGHTFTQPTGTAPEAIIQSFQDTHRPVEAQPQGPTESEMLAFNRHYEDSLAWLRAQAGQAFMIFEREIELAENELSREIDHFLPQFLNGHITRVGLVNLVILSVQDNVTDDKEHLQRWMEANLQDPLAPALQRYEERISRAKHTLDQNVLISIGEMERRYLTDLSRDLELARFPGSALILARGQQALQPNLTRTFIFTGLGAAFTAYDAYILINWRQGKIANTLAPFVKRTLERVLAKVVKKATAKAIATAVSSAVPPAAVVVAVVGSAWTAWEIYALKPSAQRNVTRAINQAREEIIQETRLAVIPEIRQELDKLLFSVAQAREEVIAQTLNF